MQTAKADMILCINDGHWSAKLRERGYVVNWSKRTLKL